MTDDRKIRLCRLGPEVLADAILILADQYDEADKLVERLLAPADSAEAQIKGELNALKRECQNYGWNAGRALAIRVRMLLSDVALSIHDAQAGVDLMLRFSLGRHRLLPLNKTGGQHDCSNSQPKCNNPVSHQRLSSD